MGEFCEVNKIGRLTEVTINRPEVMNALHPPANFELAQVFDEFAADPDPVSYTHLTLPTILRV